MDYLLPVSTNFRDDPDMDALDRAIEFQLLAERQRAIESMLSREISPGDLLDLLESQGIDPVEYMDASTAAIESTINRGLIITGCHLPTS